MILTFGCIWYKILFFLQDVSTTLLMALMGKTRFDKMLCSHIRLGILIHPYFVVRILDGIVQTKLGRNVMLQPSANIFINDEIYSSRVYDQFYTIKNNDMIVDVGAHVGVFTLRAARKARKGLVLAIEPHPYNYWLLKCNMMVNKLTNIKALELALWSSNGTTRLYLEDSDILRFQGKEYLEVKTRTLDTVVRELGINRVDFIKLDTEGAELEILQGAEETLRRNDPFLSIAAYHTPTEVQEISKYLWRVGYRIFVYKSSYIYAFKSKGKARTTLRM